MGNQSRSASQPTLWSPDRALSRMGDDTGLLLNMIGYFTEDAPELLEKLTEAIDQDQQEEATRFAHSLKGLCSSYDADVAVATALDVETDCRQGDLSAAASKLDKLSQRLDELGVELETWRKAHDS